jgi:hypothetical protein
VIVFIRICHLNCPMPSRYTEHMLSNAPG